MPSVVRRHLFFHGPMYLIENVVCSSFYVDILSVILNSNGLKKMWYRLAFSVIRELCEYHNCQCTVVSQPYFKEIHDIVYIFVFENVAF